MGSSADRGEDLILPAERERNWLKDHTRGSQVAGLQQQAVLLGRQEEWGGLRFERLVSTDSGEH